MADVDRTNLDDPSAHYGLSHGSTAPPPTQAERNAAYARRTGTPIDDHGRLTVALPAAADADPELAGKSPEEIAAILARRASHRDGCDDPKCSRCSAVDERMLRGSHATTGGGSGGGRRRRARTPAPSRVGVPIAELEMSNPKPRTISGRVSNEAYRALYATGNPAPGEMLEALGIAMRRGVSWARIANWLQVQSGEK